MKIQFQPPLAPSIQGFDFVWPKYKSTDFNRYARCLLDADYSWYEESEAELVFAAWHGEPEKLSNTNKPFEEKNVDKPWHSDERTERLAWYVLACNYNSVPGMLHKNVSVEYGIHFDLHRMKQASRTCFYELVKDKSYPKWIPYCVFFQMVLAHEHCHAWVEDLVTLANKDWYKIHPNSPSFIAQEEALCNTVGYGWAHDFLKTTLLDSTEQNEILECLKEWMRTTCPPGYNNFQPIEGLPICSYDLLYGNDKIHARCADFFIGVSQLLSDSYGLRDIPIENSIGEYFNFNKDHQKTNLGSVLPRPGTPQYASTMEKNCYWRGNKVPIYWHK
jgi:hypothetical protein